MEVGAKAEAGAGAGVAEAEAEVGAEVGGGRLCCGRQWY